MKRWIHAKTDSRITSMVYETYDNYNGDMTLTFEDIKNIVKEHLEDEDIYGMKGGKDFTEADIYDEMSKYDWYL